MKRAASAINRKLELLNDVDYEIRPIQTTCEVDDSVPVETRYAFGHLYGKSHTTGHMLYEYILHETEWASHQYHAKLDEIT